MAYERRRTQAENRAAKRFLVVFLEKYPVIARLCYPISGDENMVYIKALIPAEKESEIFEFAAALTGVIAEQEKVTVLLTKEEEPPKFELTNDDQLKGLQVMINNYVSILHKLRQFRDAEAISQRQEYLSRLNAGYEAIMQYLTTQA